MPLLVEPNRSSSKAFSSTATRGIIPAMKREAFERLVADALDDLPADIQQRLDNVDVVVEDWPDAATLRRAGVRHPMQLLGFYHGVPRTRRTRSYGLVLPDKITIYRRPLEMRSRTAEEMRATVRRVVRHEIAHHFGIGDDRLREIGAY
jgi:predicted Zn-dependent protease with MMP-like domain